MSESRPFEIDSQLRRHGVIPCSEGAPAFSVRRVRGSPIPIVIASPHAGRHYPETLILHMRQPAEAALRLEDRYADLLAQKVATLTGTALIVAHAPRAMIDLNRAPEDIDWDMIAAPSPARSGRQSAGRRSRSGLGIVPRRLPGLGELWSRKITLADLTERIDAVHRPYHLALAQLLESLRDKWGGALLIDIHSMPPLGPKTGHGAAADFVVGDRFGATCSSRIALAALDELELSGARAAHNRPYAGGYVLDRHGNPARGIHALQLEVCRATYLDNDLHEPGIGFDGVVDTIAALVRRMADELAANSSFAQAAQ